MGKRSWEESREEYEKIREKFVADVIGDTSMTMLDRLSILTDERVWDVEHFISSDGDEFREWVDEARAEEKAAAGPDGHSSGLVDTLFAPSKLIGVNYRKQQVVYYSSFLENLLGDHTPDEKIVVVSTRRPVIEIKKTVQEVVDQVCAYAIEHKVVGFTLDW